MPSAAVAGLAGDTLAALLTRSVLDRVVGADAQFLAVEDPNHPQHTLKVLVFERRSATRRVDLTALQEHFNQALPALPVLRCALAPGTGRLGRWRWQMVDQPDLDHHVVKAPPHADLNALVAACAAERLDRSHPLWRAWLLDDDREGRLVVVLALHHSLVDGRGAVRLLESLFGVAAGVTSAPDLCRGSGVGPRQLAANLPGLVGATAAGVLRSRRLARRGTAAPPAAFSAPRMPWNGPITSSRRCASVRLPLAGVRAAGKANGATVSDVLLTVVAAALREHLLALGALPDATLVASVPTALGSDASTRAHNRLGNVACALPVGVADPLSRLRLVRDAMLRARAHERVRGPDLLTRWFDYGPLLRTAHRTAIVMQKRSGRRPEYNLIASSVRGPQPLSWSGAPAREVRSFGVLTSDVGLNITSWSYGDDVWVGLVSYPEGLPRLRDLALLMPVALDQLLAAG